MNLRRSLLADIGDAPVRVLPVGGRVVVRTYERVVGLDATTGAEVWCFTPGDRPVVPTLFAVGSVLVWAQIGRGSTPSVLQAVDPADGALRWSRTLGEPPQLQSVIAHQGRVVVVDSAGASLLWLDAETGDELGRTALTRWGRSLASVGEILVLSSETGLDAGTADGLSPLPYTRVGSLFAAEQHLYARCVRLDDPGRGPVLAGWRAEGTSLRLLGELPVPEAAVHVKPSVGAVPGVLFAAPDERAQGVLRADLRAGLLSWWHGRGEPGAVLATACLGDAVYAVLQAADHSTSLCGWDALSGESVSTPALADEPLHVEAREGALLVGGWTGLEVWRP